MNFNLTYLKYFHDTVIYGSISAAARENHVSQSAISQGIAKLEAALQVKLTTHQKHKLKLTEEGEVVFNESKPLFGAVNSLIDKLHSLKGEISGVIKFACTNSIAQSILPAAYIKMKQAYPKVTLEFHRGSVNYIHEALRNEKVNFALALESAEFDVYDQESISRGCFRFYKGKNSKKTSEILVDHVQNDEVKELRNRYKERYGKDLEILDELSGWTVVLTFVQMGYGVGYLPEFMVKGITNVKEVKFDLVPIQYSICVLKSKGTLLTRAENVFLDILKTSI